MVQYLTSETDGNPLLCPSLQVADHQKYNEKADVYSFSLIMWEMLAGVKPFLGAYAILCAMRAKGPCVSSSVSLCCPLTSLQVLCIAEISSILHTKQRHRCAVSAVSGQSKSASQSLL